MDTDSYHVSSTYKHVNAFYGGMPKSMQLPQKEPYNVKCDVVVPPIPLLLNPMSIIIKYCDSHVYLIALIPNPAGFRLDIQFAGKKVNALHTFKCSVQSNSFNSFSLYKSSVQKIGNDQPSLVIKMLDSSIEIKRTFMLPIKSRDIFILNYSIELGARILIADDDDDIRAHSKKFIDRFKLLVEPENVIQYYTFGEISSAVFIMSGVLGYKKPIDRPVLVVRRCELTSIAASAGRIVSAMDIVNSLTECYIDAEACHLCITIMPKGTQLLEDDALGVAVIDDTHSDKTCLHEYKLLKDYHRVPANTKHLLFISKRFIRNYSGYYNRSYIACLAHRELTKVTHYFTPVLSCHSDCHRPFIVRKNTPITIAFQGDDITKASAALDSVPYSYLQRVDIGRYTQDRSKLLHLIIPNDLYPGDSAVVLMQHVCGVYMIKRLVCKRDLVPLPYIKDSTQSAASALEYIMLLKAALPAPYIPKKDSSGFDQRTLLFAYAMILHERLKLPAMTSKWFILD